MNCTLDVGRRLLVRPLPYKYEGLRGFLLRLAENNALTEVLDLHRFCFGAPGQHGINAAALQAAETKLGLPDSTLFAVATGLTTDERQQREFLGHRVAANHLRREQCAVCPLCLKQISAARADWELRAQVACSQHGCWLIDHCCGCKGPIKWRRAGVRKCNCGQDLSLLPSSTAPVAVQQLAQAICSRLFGALAEAPWPANFSAEMERSTLSQLLGVHELLASSRFGPSPRAFGPRAAWTARMAYQATVASKTAIALSHWPTGWHQILDQAAVGDRRIPRDRRRRFIVRKAPWSSEVHPMLDSRSGWTGKLPEPLKREFANQMAKRTVGIHMRRFVAIGASQPPAHRPCGLKFIRSNLQEGSVTDQDWISPEVMKDLLGASDEQLDTISAVGLFSANDGWYRAKELDEVVALLLRRSEEAFRAPKASFRALDRLSTGAGGELEHVLRLVKAGRKQLYRTGTSRPMRLAQLLVAIPTDKGSPRSLPNSWCWTP